MKKVDLTSHAALIGQSFSARVDMLEHVIGSVHFPSIGSYKERILAKALRDFLPKQFEVGTGFVLFPRERDADIDPDFFDELNQASFSPSKQCDLIIFDSSTVPVLFRDDDFVIVRPESVIAVIEVKGALSPRGLKDSLDSALDFGRKWRSTQQFYRDHNQDQSDRPDLFVMAWEVKKNKQGHRQISPAKTREIISSFYAKHISPSESDGFPFLDKVLVYNDYIAYNAGYYAGKSQPELGFEIAQGWITGEGRYLRKNKTSGTLEWSGDKTISTLLASLHYQSNREGFNRFFSYNDEIKHVEGISSPKDGFSPTWVDLPSSLFRMINSDRLHTDAD